MPIKKLSLSLTETDLALIQRARGNLSMASFLVRCALKVVGQEFQAAHHLPDKDERNKTVILRCLQNGCVGVEDIESAIFCLNQAEIESYLYELEMEGVIHRARAKRGRMWRWELGPEPDDEGQEATLP